MLAEGGTRRKRALLYSVIRSVTMAPSGTHVDWLSGRGLVSNWLSIEEMMKAKYRLFDVLLSSYRRRKERKRGGRWTCWAQFIIHSTTAFLSFPKKITIIGSFSYIQGGHHNETSSSRWPWWCSLHNSSLSSRQLTFPHLSAWVPAGAGDWVTIFCLMQRSSCCRLAD